MKKPIVAYLSFILPALAIIYGIYTVFIFERSESDWGLLSGFVGLIVAVFAGASLSVILSALSFLRRERIARNTLYLSIPSLCLLLYVGIAFLNGYTSNKKSKNEEDVFRRTYSEIRNDRSLLKSRNWTNASAPELRAFKNSLKFGTGPYTEEDIVYIYKTYPNFRVLAFKHPSCPERLLTKHFDEAWLSFKSGESSFMLDAICSNPNTPKRLLEKVARETHESHSAHTTLKKLAEQVAAPDPSPSATPQPD